MLISYPILRQDNIHDDEDIYLANVIESALVNTEGRYPISTLTTPQGQVHRWHGGVHLYGGGEPIRAIADGTVVACRFTAARETYEGLGDYDTSFVLLRHETQSGENTTVVFYSLYMHLANQADLAADRLSQLPTWLRNNPGTDVKRPANQRVWRKDVLGFAGQLYGRETCHFEVFMLDADFNRVWHDSSSIAQGTGDDDWFGDAHFVIPAQRDFAASHPRATTQGILIQDAPGTQHDVYFPTPPGVTGRNDEKLYVSVSLHQGRRIATTYREAATGGYEQVGHPVLQDNYEYELYRLSTALYPDCPSAGLEWLRFGRVLGSDTTTRNENWQLVCYSDSAVGYIDLAPNEIVKLSDADFPHWQGWKRSDEGATANAADGLCDDADVIALAQATGEDAERRLRHMICKAPTEWDDSDLATRYARMREDGQPLQSDESWGKFQEHVSKMAFWTGAGMTDRSVWHFHPLQFIRHARKCAWLSRDEFRQMQPSHALRRSGNQYHWEAVPAMATAANSVPERYLNPLNSMMRKYGIVTANRKASFLGNAIQETSWLQRLSEFGGSGLWYAPWFGRGFLQLTNPENYCNYWAWRGRNVSSALRTALISAYSGIAGTQPASARTNTNLQDSQFSLLTQEIIEWRSAVAGATSASIGPEELLAPVDSAGYYWTKLSMARYADQSHVLERVSVSTSQGQRSYYRSPAFWRASAAVNLPGAINNTYSNSLNGFDSRCCAYGVVLAVASEIRFTNAQGAQAALYPEGYTPRRV